MVDTQVGKYGTPVGNHGKEVRRHGEQGHKPERVGRHAKLGMDMRSRV